jgi:RepB DNA-primase from phage plasmid
MEGRVGRPDTEAALAMLEAFASVGATEFDITWTNIEEAPKRFQSHRSVAELRTGMAERLEVASRLRCNVIIRPRSDSVLLIQLDDLSTEKVAQLEQFAFMTVTTSPGNYQVWLAVEDGPKQSEAAKLFRTRVRRGAGADHSATGAVRLAGSLNFKPKYAPDFPEVHPGRMTTVAALDQAGLIAPEAPPAAASVPGGNLPSRPIAGRYWPDYQQALRGAPMRRDGTGPDRSLADYMWCKWAIERGWSIQETAEKLAAVSPKAQERIRVKNDPGYTVLTARNAGAAVQRERARRQAVKSTARS